jgi:Ca2+-binding RTX toxin-like protein
MAITAAEQYLVELINRARLDPATEARRLDIPLNGGLPLTTNGSTFPTISKQAHEPLAIIGSLDRSATSHSADMARTGDFSHVGSGGSTYITRIKAAGYDLSGGYRIGENLAYVSWSSDPTSLMNILHKNLFGSPPHRSNMIQGDYREIGVSLVGSGSGQYLTENFGYHSATSFVTGVAYTDRNNDDFYSIGEGRSGLSMKIIGGDGANTQSAGGYALQAKWGQEVTVAIEGGTRVKVDLDHGNVKLDVVNNSLLKVSGDVTLLTGPIKNVEALGVGAVNLTGNDLRNRLTGSDGRNVLTGAGGSDTLSGRNGNDILRGGDGADALAGNGGADHLNGNSGADRLTGGTGADTFQFATGSGADVVTDFTMGQGDRLGLAKSLWGGGLTDQQVVSRYAEVLGGNVLFDFGDGDTLLLQGVRSLNGLADRIDFL